MSASIADLSERVAAFASGRNWSQFHDPKNLAMAIASEAGELCSLLRWVRSEDADKAAGDATRRQAIRNEIGDITILILLLCSRLGVTLDDVVIEKLAINAENYPSDVSRGRAERP
jgi:dCTP diphosphatase